MTAWLSRVVAFLDAWVPCRHTAAVVDLQPGAIRLRCPDCRRVTAGWGLGPARYRLTQAGKPDRHRLDAPVTARLIVGPGPIPIFPDIDALADYLASGGSDAAVLMDEPKRPQ